MSDVYVFVANGFGLDKRENREKSNLLCIGRGYVMRAIKNGIFFLKKKNTFECKVLTIAKGV